MGTLGRTSSLLYFAGKTLGEMDKVNKIVMIADSDQHVCNLLSRFLADAGYTVTRADDGYKALDSARLEPPMAILTEVLLPRLDGLALCRLIKSDAATENITSVIVLSVLAAEERALTAGADAFMQKPLEKKRLLMILEQANSKRGLIHEA